MQLNFFSGKGFSLTEAKNKIYLYRNTGKIHIYGELCKLLDDFQEPFIHIFNELSEPVLIYFTPVLIDDNINTKSRAKEAVKMARHNDGHYSGSCTKLFKNMNIPAGPSKQKGSESSGYYLEYYMQRLLDRECTVINLNHIEGWSFNGSRV